MMPRIRRILAYWLPLAAVSTGICLFIYVAIQQNYRMNANDPQIQLAEDAAVTLAKTHDAPAVIPQAQVELSKSLAPFVMVFEKSGKPMASSGLLGNSVPEFPDGALTASEKTGENRVTWEPQPGLRFAAVVVAYSDGYVVAARSLREVENRIQQTTIFAGLTLISALVVTLILVASGDFLAFPNPRSPIPRS